MCGMFVNPYVPFMKCAFDEINMNFSEAICPDPYDHREGELPSYPRTAASAI
jgi:hypothetical protein